MDLSNLKAPKGATKNRKRVGRGVGSTLDKTSGRGQKGQKARSGGSIPPGFEGGQMPLYRRLPKAGFRNKFSKEIAAINVRLLEREFEDGDVVDLDALCERGLIPARFIGSGDSREVELKVDGIKILGDGELTKKLTVHAHSFSKSAAAKIEGAGGSAEIIEA